MIYFFCQNRIGVFTFADVSAKCKNMGQERKKMPEPKRLEFRKTKDITYIAVFAVMIAICSWISIPAAVPFTLQTFAVFFAVGVLGGKRGTLAVLVYILLGAAGIPVFAGFSGGIGVLAGQTGGYIAGFLFSAFVMWGIEKIMGRKLPVQILSMTLGLLACYAVGTAWFMLVYARTAGTVGVGAVLGWCVIPFILPDAAKIVLACVLSRKLAPVLKNMEG